MKKNGFTLTEIISVIVIIGILILVVIPVGRWLISNNQQKKISINKKSLESAIITYSETEYKDLECVGVKLNDLIQKGYIAEDNIDLNKYKNDVDSYLYYNKKTNEISTNNICVGLEDNGEESDDENAIINNP